MKIFNLRSAVLRVLIKLQRTQQPTVINDVDRTVAQKAGFDGIIAVVVDNAVRAMLQARRALRQAKRDRYVSAGEWMAERHHLVGTNARWIPPPHKTPPPPPFAHHPPPPPPYLPPGAP